MYESLAMPGGSLHLFPMDKPPHTPSVDNIVGIRSGRWAYIHAVGPSPAQPSNLKDALKHAREVGFGR